MVREYHKWFSPSLNRDMELLVFGHYGRRVIVFPTRQGRFYDYENFKLVGALRDRIEAGALQLYCVDSVDNEALYCGHCNPRDRASRQVSFENYILKEVLPFSHSKNYDPRVVSHGCSFGAYHAVNIALRHPHAFSEIVAFSGRFDLTKQVGTFPSLFDGYYDQEVYFLMPNHYLPNLYDEHVLNRLRRLRIVLAIGAEDPFLESNRELSNTLWQKGIFHEMYIWEGEAHRARNWRHMSSIYMAYD